MSPPKPSPQIGQAAGLNAQDVNTQQLDYSAAQGTNQQFEGPVTSSPFYQSLLTTGTDATSNAYQNAMSASKSRANQTGFGSSSPTTDTAAAGIQSQEASAMGKLPSAAAAEAAPLSLEASGQTAGMGTAAGAQGLGYDASVQVPLQEQYNTEMQQYQQSLWNSIAQIPMDLVGL